HERFHITVSLLPRIVVGSRVEGRGSRRRNRSIAVGCVASTQMLGVCVAGFNAPVSWIRLEAIWISYGRLRRFPQKSTCSSFSAAAACCRRLPETSNASGQNGQELVASSRLR